MSVKDTIVREVTCDICGVECNPVSEKHFPVRFTNDYSIDVRMRVWAFVPYGTDHGDVCIKCFDGVLLAYLQGKNLV